MQEDEHWQIQPSFFVGGGGGDHLGEGSHAGAS